MEIYILSSTFETLGVLAPYKSLTHSREFAGSGSFKLRLPYTDKMFDLLTEDNILMWEDGGTRAVYIDTVVCETEKDGEMMTVSGKNLRGLLDRRIIWHPWKYHLNGYAETIGRMIVDENAVNPLDSDRVIPGLVLGDTTGAAASTPYLSIEPDRDNVETFLNNLTETAGVGFDIRYDKHQKQMIFEAYMGTDHTAGQSENPKVIISRDRNRVSAMTYSRSGASSKNTALIIGWENEDTGVIYSDSILSGSGLGRREIYVKGSSSKPKADENEGITLADAEARYAAEQRQKAAEELAERKPALSLDVDVDRSSIPGLDLGDRVTVRERRYNNLTMNTHIAEITAYYEGGGAVYNVVLGDAIPTVYKKLIVKSKEMRK